MKNKQQLYNFVINSLSWIQCNTIMFRFAILWNALLIGENNTNNQLTTNKHAALKIQMLANF